MEQPTPKREPTEQPVRATHSKRETIESPPPERTPHSGSMLSDQPSSSVRSPILKPLHRQSFSR